MLPDVLGAGTGSERAGAASFPGHIDGVLVRRVRAGHRLLIGGGDAPAAGEQRGTAPAGQREQVPSQLRKPRSGICEFYFDPR